jgi:diguanylate cyclase (GGDEF)-like protein
MGAQEVADAVLAGCLLAGLAIGAGSVRRLLRATRESEERIWRLERLASTDDLTGLPNRRQWEEQLPRELGRSLRYDESVCVAMLDLDHFKHYNDTHGHPAGDRLLKEIASAWRAVLRPYDLLARYGGEKFSLILAGSKVTEAEGIIERLRTATPGDVSCSAGMAWWDGEEPPACLVSRADKALYEAKRCGRDQTIVSLTARPAVAR